MMLQPNSPYVCAWCCSSSSYIAIRENLGSVVVIIGVAAAVVVAVVIVAVVMVVEKER